MYAGRAVPRHHSIPAHARPRNWAPTRSPSEDKAVAARAVQAAAAGDAAAWEELVQRYSGLLWAVARRHRLNDADARDVLQTVWLRLLQHAGRLRQPEEVAAWLSTTARNECLRLIRTRRREVLVDNDAALEPSDPPQDPVGAAATRPPRDTALWAAVDRLPERQRRVLLALMTEPAPSYADVSVALGVPVGAIGPTRARALCRLRAMPEIAALLGTRHDAPTM